MLRRPAVISGKAFERMGRSGYRCGERLDSLVHGILVKRSECRDGEMGRHFYRGAG